MKCAFSLLSLVVGFSCLAKSASTAPSRVTISSARGASKRHTTGALSDNNKAGDTRDRSPIDAKLIHLSPSNSDVVHARRLMLRYESPLSSAETIKDWATRFNPFGEAHSELRKAVAEYIGSEDFRHQILHANPSVSPSSLVYRHLVKQFTEREIAHKLELLEPGPLWWTTLTDMLKGKATPHLRHAQFDHWSSSPTLTDRRTPEQVRDMLSAKGEGETIPDSLIERLVRGYTEHYNAVSRVERVPKTAAARGVE